MPLTPTAAAATHRGFLQAIAGRRMSVHNSGGYAVATMMEDMRSLREELASLHQDMVTRHQSEELEPRVHKLGMTVASDRRPDM